MDKQQVTANVYRLLENIIIAYPAQSWIKMEIAIKKIKYKKTVL